MYSFSFGIGRTKNFRDGGTFKKKDKEQEPKKIWEQTFKLFFVLSRTNLNEQFYFTSGG